MAMAFRGIQTPPIDPNNLQSTPYGLGPGYDQQLAAAPMAMPAMKPVRLGFNDVGGAGDHLHQFAAALMAAGGNQQGANNLLDVIGKRQEDEFDRQKLAAQQAGLVQQQQAELQRQLAVAAFNRLNPPKTALQQNKEYFDTLDPTGRMGMSYANGQANPTMAVQTIGPGGVPGYSFFPRNGYGTDAGGGQAAIPGGPPVGTVRGGYRFKGGNPNDATAWEAVGGAGSGQPGFR